MRRSALIAAAGGFILGGSVGSAGAEETPPAEEIWRIVQEQRAEIERLKRRLGEAEAKVEATGDRVEAAQSARGDGGEGWWRKTHLGGYGELHYNAGDADQIDLHRLVLGIGHDFTDDLRFESEIEFEHALIGDGEPGEVAVEQAYVEYDITDSQRVKGGMVLVPVGILNETHEPPTFFGVERNKVETNIIPTTWSEGGVAASGELGAGFSYDLAVHSGLKVATTGSNAFKIRNGRQKVAEAKATDGAITGRLKWTGHPGVELGLAAQYQDDLTQNAQGLGTSATMVEAHGNLRFGGWGLRALYARWDLDKGPAFTGAGAYGRDIQHGWYVEPSYRFDISAGEVGVFARYSGWDNEAGNGTDSLFQKYDVGLNYWPHPDVVLKIDGEFQHNPSGRGRDDNRVNLGIGYQF